MTSINLQTNPFDIIALDAGKQAFSFVLQYINVIVKEFKRIVNH